MYWITMLKIKLSRDRLNYNMWIMLRRYLNITPPPPPPPKKKKKANKKKNMQGVGRPYDRLIIIMEYLYLERLSLYWDGALSVSSYAIEPAYPALSGLRIVL